MPIKTSSGKWKWGNVERSSKKELVQTVYGIWKKNGSKGSFSDFLKGTHESVEPKDKFFKVKKNGKEIGKYGLSFYDDIKAVGIGDLEVYPEFRNKGYGTKIIKDIIDKYKNDYDKIYCFVDKDNKDAIRLYKRLGKVSDEITYSQKIGDYEYKNTNGQHYVEFYNKLKESMIAEDTKRYAYHCTNVDPEIIKKEGWKVGNGFTLDNQFEDLYKKYLPKVPIFVSRLDVPVWDSKAKYCIKLDITGLELFPDFGYLPDFGAYYDYDEECFYWENEDDLDSNKKLKDFVLDNCDNLTLYADCFDGDDSFNVLGTACVDGSKLKDRIVEWKSNIKESLVKEYWAKNGRYFYCYDCDKNMSKAPDDQYIMIDDDLWEYVCKHGGKKIGTEEDLCRDCIEKRLGRPLTLKDLGNKINLPINDEIKKILKKRKNKMTNEAHEIHSYPETLQPIIDRIVKGNEDYELDHAYFNKEGKFIWMRNSKGYFHIFKPVKLKNVKWKPFAFRDMILQDDGMMKPLDLIQFENGQEGLKYLQQKYNFEIKSMTL